MSDMPCHDDPARTALVSRHRFRALVGTTLDMILRIRAVEPVLFAGFTRETGVEPGLRETARPASTASASSKTAPLPVAWKPATSHVLAQRSSSVPHRRIHIQYVL